MTDPDCKTASEIANSISLLEDLTVRVREARAVLTAIDAGEFLAVLPAGPARLLHQTGLSLLEVLGRELDAVTDRLNAL